MTPFKFNSFASIIALGVAMNVTAVNASKLTPLDDGISFRNKTKASEFYAPDDMSIQAQAYWAANPRKTESKERTKKRKNETGNNVSNLTSLFEKLSQQNTHSSKKNNSARRNSVNVTLKNNATSSYSGVNDFRDLGVSVKERQKKFIVETGTFEPPKAYTLRVTAEQATVEKLQQYYTITRHKMAKIQRAVLVVNEKYDTAVATQAVISNTSDSSEKAKIKKVVQELSAKKMELSGELRALERNLSTTSGTLQVKRNKIAAIIEEAFAQGLVFHQKDGKISFKGKSISSTNTENQSAAKITSEIFQLASKASDQAAQARIQKTKNNSSSSSTSSSSSSQNTLSTDETMEEMAKDLQKEISKIAAKDEDNLTVTDTRTDKEILAALKANIALMEKQNYSAVLGDKMPTLPKNTSVEESSFLAIQHLMGWKEVLDDASRLPVEVVLNEIGINTMKSITRKAYFSESKALRLKDAYNSLVSEEESTLRAKIHNGSDILLLRTMTELSYQNSPTEENRGDLAVLLMNIGLGRYNEDGRLTPSDLKQALTYFKMQKRVANEIKLADQYIPVILNALQQSSTDQTDEKSKERSSGISSSTTVTTSLPDTLDMGLTDTSEGDATESPKNEEVEAPKLDTTDSFKEEDTTIEKTPTEEASLENNSISSSPAAKEEDDENEKSKTSKSDISSSDESGDESDYDDLDYDEENVGF